MTHALGMRATSLAAASLMLGVSVMAALSVTYTIRAVIDAPPGPIVVVETPPPPPPPLPVEFTPPPRAPADVANYPLLPIETHEAATIESAEFFLGPVSVENPRWARRPRDLADYFPRRALGLGVQGEVVLDCLVTVQGALSCAIISETPLNWGFGAAALRISRDHQMVPATRDGIPAEGRYRMRVPFRVVNRR